MSSFLTTAAPTRRPTIIRWVPARWGQGLTRAKMAECRWLKPVLVGQFEFLEWTADQHLRHVKFVALRDDRRARDVRLEPPIGSLEE